MFAPWPESFPFSRRNSFERAVCGEGGRRGFEKDYFFCNYTLFNLTRHVLLLERGWTLKPNLVGVYVHMTWQLTWCHHWLKQSPRPFPSAVFDLGLTSALSQCLSGEPKGLLAPVGLSPDWPRASHLPFPTGGLTRAAAKHSCSDLCPRPHDSPVISVLGVI